MTMHIVNNVYYYYYYYYYVQNQCMFGFDRYTNHVLLALRYFAMRCYNLLYKLSSFAMLHN